MTLRHILKPIKIGRLDVKNRIVRTGHATYHSQDRFIGGPDLTAYHQARAKDGCGLSMLEAGEVHESSSHGTSIADDRIIPRYQHLMNAVRPYGMRVFQQLWHAGNIWPAASGFALGASTVAGPWGLVPLEVTHEQIEELTSAYVAAALRCQEGTLDGVEVHAAHGYLPVQFLSPAINTRTDEYGGSFENRLRFLRDIMRAVRKAVGTDFVVGARFSTSVFSEVLGVDDMVRAVETLQGEGLVDYVNASYGDYFRVDSMNPGMHEPTGANLPFAAPLMAVAKLPRITGGRFRTLEEADQVIHEGVADMVSLVRAQIADPTLITKTLAGQAERVRPCIACNQGCIAGVFRDHRVGCVVNVAMGRELTLSEDLIRPTSAPKKVMIVGGGPAGLEAARIAATIGHKVILAEAMPSLGGTINVAKRAPYLHTMGDITYWLEAEIYRLGVEVRLNTFVEPDDVRAEKPDVLIVATGSQPRMDGVQSCDPGAQAEGVHLPHVISSTDLLTDPNRVLGKTALVLDNTGQYEAIAATDYLLSKGLAVTFVSTDFSFAEKVRPTLRDDPALKRFENGDFTMMIRHMLVAARPGFADVRPVQHSKIKTVPADTVVLVTTNLPVRDLYLALHKEMDVSLVGDAVTPRDLYYAIQEGHHAARRLQGAEDLNLVGRLSRSVA